MLDFLLHVDVYLTDFVADYGTLTYAILFAIIFAETGLVVTPVPARAIRCCLRPARWPPPARCRLES